MKKHLCAVIFICSITTVLAVDRTYYAALDCKAGATLFSTLTTITNTGYKELGYDGLYQAYRQTDVYPDDSVGKAGMLWDTYGGCSFDWDENCGNYKRECDCFNREHSIPKSWWGGSIGSIGNDIFHVIPTDGYVNGRRSNYPLGEVKSVEYQYNGCKVGTSGTSSIGKVFEPQAQFKGDFARAYFGVIMKWNTSKKLTSGNGPTMFQSTYTAATNYGLTDYAVQLLLKWHREDPVSEKEIQRNNAIQATQGNRNPFIDFPYLVEYIWGEYAGKVVDFNSLLGSFEEGFIPGQSNGLRDGSVPNPTVTNDTITWLLNNNVYHLTVYQRGNLPTLPEQPQICNPNIVFMGWTDRPITDQNAQRPALLFNTSADIPIVVGNRSYYAVIASAEEGKGDQYAGITFGDIIKENALTVTNVSINDNVSIAFASTGTNPAKYYTNGNAIRVYPGGTMTVSSDGVITAITLRFGSDDKTNTISTKGGTWNEPHWTGNDNSVVFTINGANGHRKIAGVDVTYGGGIGYSNYATTWICNGTNDIICNTPTEIEQLSIYTITGLKLMDITTLNSQSAISSLPSGVYIIKTPTKAYKLYR